MRGYRIFIIIFLALFVVYLVAELNKPAPVDWTLTISEGDKNPYGGYIIYNRLKDLFPGVPVQSNYLPVYNQVDNLVIENSAYLVATASFSPSKFEYHEIMNYIAQGNYMMVSAEDFGRSFLDSLKVSTSRNFSLSNKDTTRINFVNPLLKSKKGYGFINFALERYFEKIDTAGTVVLGTNNRGRPDFIKIKKGKGALFLHTSPACFSNYFMLYANNANYTSRALSYIPPGVSKIFWDEAGKMDQDVTPLAFLIRNTYLRWALRIAVAVMILYVLFYLKRRQRVIPIIKPLQNSSLDFIKIVSTLYFNQKNNNNIADKKVLYFLDFIRHRFYLQTNELDETFIEQLARKSGNGIEQTRLLVKLINRVKGDEQVGDQLLFALDQNIDNFYKQL